MAEAFLGLGLAFSLAAPPGPMNALIAFAATSRATKGTAVGLGAVTADAIFLVLVLLVRGHIPSSFLKMISVLGGGVLILMSYQVLKNTSIRTPSVKADYLSGLSLGLSNPFQIGWWLTAGLTMISYFGYSSAIGFFSGLIIWVSSFPYAIWKLSLHYGSNVITIIRYVSALGLVAFATYFIYSGII